MAEVFNKVQEEDECPEGEALDTEIQPFPPEPQRSECPEPRVAVVY
jgi:hypothetical protein